MNTVQRAFLDDRCVLDVEADNMQLVLKYAVSHLVAQGVLPIEHRDAVEAALREREDLGGTAIGHAVAVPHAYLKAFRGPVILFMRLARPVNLGAPDGVPTRFIFVLMGPPDSAGTHLDSLAAIVRLMSDDEFRFDALQAQNQKDFLAALERFHVRTTPVEAFTIDHAAEGLDFTGRPFGGIMRDLSRRLPSYVSDYVDGAHPKCLSAVLFLFFACLAPAVTFGGVMAVQTEGAIGAVEMIVATAVCGVCFAIFAGQPLIILGGTGPLLVFTAILYRLCGDLEIPFLPTYAWVGIWTGLFTLILALTDASFLMRYFTRFTDEVFAALISLIFIYEALKAILHLFQDLESGDHHATALFSLLLAVGTLYIASNLSSFRRSRYLQPQVREFLSDFGPTIAIVVMTGFAMYLHEVDLDILPAPDRFGTTNGRDWFVSPIGAPMWVWFASIVPAMLATVLVFLDQNITARLVNSREHHLQKGPAYHLDLVVVGVLIAGCSLFALPWLVAATVRSLNHLRSLASIEEVVTFAGDRRDRIIHVRENRVSAVAIHLLVGLSLLLLPLLKQIPLAVLYGLFLYMGIVSMRGNQLFERLSLWPMDQNLYPSTHYIRQVPLTTIHKFTLLQMICLIVLWVVKTSSLGILFPLFIGLLVPIRLAADKFFLAKHLIALDGEQAAFEEATRQTE